MKMHRQDLAISAESRLRSAVVSLLPISLYLCYARATTMAEALGIAASAVGIATLAAQLSRGIVDICGAFKDAPGELIRLQGAVEQTGHIMKMMNEYRDSIIEDDDGFTPAKPNVLTGLEQSVLEDLKAYEAFVQKMNRQRRKMVDSPLFVDWFFKKNKNEELRKRLEVGLQRLLEVREFIAS